MNANIIEGCNELPGRLRGIDTFDVGVDLQTEARREGFAVTLECIQAKRIGRLEAIFGHGRDRPAATRSCTARQSRVPGRQAAQRPVRRLQVYLAGFEDQREAEAFVSTGEGTRLRSSSLERN